MLSPEVFFRLILALNAYHPIQIYLPLFRIGHSEVSAGRQQMAEVAIVDNAIPLLIFSTFFGFFCAFL